MFRAAAESAGQSGEPVNWFWSFVHWARAHDAVFVYPFLLAGFLVGLDRLLSRRHRRGNANQRRWRWLRPLGMLFATVVGLVGWSLFMVEYREWYLQLLSALMAGALALAATSPIGNLLTGLMMRTQRHFRAGDWIESESLVGRVSERGLFFVEVQDETSNLVTLPNTWLAARPVTVIRCPPTPLSPYTLVDAEVTLGYDVPRQAVERLLADAARSCSLHEPWVEVCELGNFSVRYRVRGRTSDTQSLMRLRSALRAAMLDTLHEAGVEIVSPNFMNQRVLSETAQVVPARDEGPEPDLSDDPDRDAFERASVGSELSGLEATIDWFGKRIERLEGLKSRVEEGDRGPIERRIESLREEQEHAQKKLQTLAEATDEKRREDAG